MSLHQHEIIFYSLAIAFCLVEFVIPGLKRRYYMWRFRRFNPGHDRLKPFDCTKCMCGWLALSIALISGYGWESLLIFAAGVFVGSLFEAIKMRWL